MAHGYKQFCFWGWGKVAGGIGYGADQRSAPLNAHPLLNTSSQFLIIEML